MNIAKRHNMSRHRFFYDIRNKIAKRELLDRKTFQRFKNARRKRRNFVFKRTRKEIVLTPKTSIFMLSSKSLLIKVLLEKIT